MPKRKKQYFAVIAPKDEADVQLWREASNRVFDSDIYNPYCQCNCKGCRSNHHCGGLVCKGD